MKKTINQDRQMLKTSTQLTSRLENGKEGHFLLDSATTVQEAKEMLIEFITHVCNIENQQKAQLAAQAQQASGEGAQMDAPASSETASEPSPSTPQAE